jgi:hypothetical protein
MSGIILLLIIGTWFFVVKKLSDFSVLNMQAGTKKVVIHKLLFAFMFVAPVADEIVGGFQFRAMCTPESLLIYEPEKLRGKTVETKESTTRTINKIIPIKELTREWIDSDTKEVLITRKIYWAKGGWLSRLAPMQQGSPPFTFNEKCSSKEYYQLFEKLNVTKIEN